MDSDSVMVDWWAMDRVMAMPPGCPIVRFGYFMDDEWLTFGHGLFSFPPSSIRPLEIVALGWQGGRWN